MKRFGLLRLAAAMLTLTAALSASANVVGYVNIYFLNNNYLVGNPLDAPPNSLNVLFGPSTPDGSTLATWNPATQQYNPISTFSTVYGWDNNYLLPPGQGALFHAASPFTNTFAGEVLGGLTPPTPPALPNGRYLLSSLWPQNGRTFHDIIGRDANDGETVTTLNPVTQVYTTTTWTGGVWNNGTPTLDIGQAAFFNLGPVPLVPEPTALSLLGVGVALWSFRRRGGR